MMELSHTHWLKLIRTKGLGPKTLLPLIEKSNDLNELLKFADEKIARKIAFSLDQADSPSLEQDLQWLDSNHHHLIPVHDPLYPSLLKQIADPPLALFVHGDPSLLNLPQIAIVGSRNPSKTGQNNAFAFAEYLSQSGIIITSGMALGIDAKAHQGCLSAKGKTLAITGTGLDRVYPAHHRSLAHDIVESGALISEYPLGTPPIPSNFPRRNRIISALSVGTLVVEAAIKSGSLITAHQALEQGREVFAIPGSIHNPLSKGCHQLIKEGAKLVENAHDIIEELSPLLSALQITPSQTTAVKDQPIEALLDDDYQFFLTQMGWDPISTDEIIDRTQLKPDIVSSMLLLLELQGHVSSAPGGYYNREVPASETKTTG